MVTRRRRTGFAVGSRQSTSVELANCVLARPNRALSWYDRDRELWDLLQSFQLKLCVLKTKKNVLTLEGERLFIKTVTILRTRKVYGDVAEPCLTKGQSGHCNRGLFINFRDCEICR